MDFNAADVGNAYNRLAEEEERQENSFSLRTEIPREFIRRYIQKNDIVLDAGCGAGVNSKMMVKLSKHVTSLDISPAMVEKTQEKLRYEIEKGCAECNLGNVCDLSEFGDEEFDFVVCVGDAVSYSLDQHENALRELIRVAKENAIIIIGCDSKLGFSRLALMDGKLNEFEKIMENGYAKDWTGVQTRTFEIHEMETLFQKNSCEMLEIASTPTFSDTFDKSIYSTAEERSRLLEIEMKYCRKHELLGMGHHLLFVAKKNKKEW